MPAARQFTAGEGTGAGNDLARVEGQDCGDADARTEDHVVRDAVHLNPTRTHRTR